MYHRQPGMSNAELKKKENERQLEMFNADLKGGWRVHASWL